jgi:hypothetical protein
MTLHDYEKSDDFHLRFIEFFLQNNFPHVYLWSYMNIYNNALSIHTQKRFDQLSMMCSFRNILSGKNVYMIEIKRGLFEKFYLIRL